MLDWYIVLFVYSNHPHTKMEKGMKDKEKKKLLDIKLTEEDIEVTLLELKRKVGAPRLDFSDRAWRKK
jgi:hypothetical protein|tara:strand:+ start:360 stop:563 length:204 start_codon:yes stop_codon:yes gene_type:complete